MTQTHYLGEPDAAWLELAFTPHIGAERFAALMDYYGSAAEALADAAQWQGMAGLKVAAKAVVQGNVLAKQAVEAALAWSQQADCRLMTSADVDFPSMLREGITPSPVLFLRGNPAWLHYPAVSIVGSRHATPQAMRIARDFAEALSKKGVVVVSGMAAGIDTAAHEGALHGATGTVAVWGTGVDRVYPAANKALAHRIADQGVVVSEFPLGTRPLAGNFPRRNRLIAALGVATLVIEASLASGSLITAKLAADMGREVMAVPGSIDNPQSKGCHQLIKEGAKLVECLEDILAECGILLQNPPPSAYAINKVETKKAVAKKNHQQIKPESLDVSTTVLKPQVSMPSEVNVQGTDDPLWQAMGFDPIHPDTLAEYSGWNTADVYARLLEWELEGKVAALAGGRYQRIDKPV